MAYVYSVSIGFACCYAADLAVCSNSHLTQLSACGGDLAVVAACIAYVQLAVTQCGIFIEYAIFQNYVADFTCSCDYFAVFIYGEVVVCCVECAGAVYKERHNSVFCHSTYGQVVFGVQCIGLNIVYINVFVQLNLNLSAVMAYADVLVTAEVNIIVGFYVGCFGCNTVGRQIPTCISSVAYFLQLAYVYSVSIGFACCYTGNLAACYIQATADGCSVFTKHDGFCTIISTDIAHANTAVSNCKVFITIGNDDAIFIQVNFGISIGNRGNISQIACNINLVFQMTISSSHRVHCCIFAVR